MDHWKIVLDEDVFQFFVSSRPKERRTLMAAFEALRSNPRRQADYFVRDPTGRSLSVWACRPFLITYWLDALVWEIRLVNLQRVSF